MGQTPEPMTTERSCMRVAGRSSEQNLWMPSGKRSTKNGARDHQRGCLSGSVRGQARSLEILRPLKVRKRVVKHLQLKKKKRKRRKKRRKRNKSLTKLF